MGLLDFGDSPQDAGLLSLGLRLMSTPGKFGTALGQAGLGAMGDYRQAQQIQEQRKLREQQAQEQALRQKMLEMQLAQAQQAQEQARAQAQRDEQFRSRIPSPQGQALQALGADASPTVANAARMPAVDPQQQFLYEALQARQIKPMEYMTAMKKDDAPVTLSEGQVLLSGKASGYKPLARGGVKEDDFIRNMRAAGIQEGSPQWIQLLTAKAQKDSTHQEPVRVSYGAPVAGVDANGNPVFFQPGKDGGPPAIVPGVKPAPPKLGEKQQNQVVGIDALGQAVDAYVGALGQWSKRDMVNPDKRAQIGTYYNNMMLQAKEAYNLGVLNGPDLQILENVVRNPLTMVGMVTSNEAMAKQATDLKRIMNKIKAGIVQKPGAENAPQGAGPRFLGFEQ